MNVLPQCNNPKLIPREFKAHSRHIHIAQINICPGTPQYILLGNCLSKENRAAAIYAGTGGPHHNGRDGRATEFRPVGANQLRTTGS
jgi:hypothetical protein